MKLSIPELVGPLALALVLATSTCVSGQTTTSIEDIAFLTGCWAGDFGGLELREQWSETEGGMMLGTTRFFREGKVVDFEFGMFVEDEDGLALWPYPQGERSADGFPLVSAGAELVFENLEHDFPVRIVYRRDGADTVRPRIEGRDGQTREWYLTRIECPTA
jgi:hypothetical protein